ncbi:MAG: RsmD family RNA methyltransferase [Thermoguttaceae bacterium]
MKQNKKRNVGSAPGDRGGVVGLRVIGGELRGSRLLYAGDNRVRPMKDRVRESLFNLIGLAVRQTCVIDLFAGTGALAIEALSRGAATATLVEQHLPTLRAARQNVESLKLESRCQLVMADAFYWSHQCQEVSRERPWLVFCSPPYSFFSERTAEMMALIERIAAAAPAGSEFVVEADARFDFANLPLPLDPRRRRSYPPAEVAILSIGTNGEM